MTRNDLISMLGLLPQFNDTNASMDLDPPGQPDGGSPGEGYLKCVQSLEPI